MSKKYLKPPHNPNISSPNELNEDRSRTFEEQPQAPSTQMFKATLAVPSLLSPPNHLQDVQCEESRNHFILHLPAFLRVKMSRLISTDINQGTAQVSLVIILTVWYNQLPEELVKQIERSIRLNINDMTQLNLVPEEFAGDTQINIKVDNINSMKQLCIITRGIFAVGMEADMEKFPFERIKLNIKIDIRSKTCSFLGKDALVYFNYRVRIKDAKETILTQQNFNKYVSCERLINLSNFYQDRVFALDYSSLSYQVKQEHDKGGVEHVTQQNFNEKAVQNLRWMRIDPREFQFLDHWRQLKNDYPQAYNKLTISMSLIRYPLQIFLGIIIPVSFLCFINFATFLLNKNLAERIGCIATVLIAYSTYLPTLRQRMPEYHKLNMMEVVMYSVITSGFLSLLRSVLNYIAPPTNYKCINDPIFKACLITTGIVIAGIIVMFILSHIELERVKNSRPSQAEINKFKPLTRLSIEEMRHWQNPGQFTIKPKSEKKNLLKSYHEIFEENDIFLRLWIWRLQHALSQDPPSSYESIPEIAWKLRFDLRPYYRKAFASLSKYYKRIVDFQEEVERQLVEACSKPKESLSPDLASKILSLKQEYINNVNEFLREFRWITQEGTLDHEFNIVQSNSPRPRRSTPFLPYSTSADLVAEILSGTVL